MQHEGNGNGKTEAAMLARWEAALESERRQREQLERRLQEAERQLQQAMASVSAATPDVSLLELKSQLAAELESAKGRAKLEHQLLELEFAANARAEIDAQPRYIPAPRVVTIPEPLAETPRKKGKGRAPAPAAKVNTKDFDDKLAAAQMAIDAAEARATHNAIQVRKLTEELAFARAEQLRLASEMRSLRERLDMPGLAAPASPAALEPPAAVEDLAEPWAPPALEESPREDPASAVVLEPLSAGPDEPPLRESEDVALNLEDALEDFGAGGGDGASSSVSLEDALAFFGEYEESASEPEASSAELEDALAVFSEPGESAGSVAQGDDDETAALEDALAAFGEDTPGRPVIDAPELGGNLEDALAAFGEDAQDPEAFAAGVTPAPHAADEDDEMVAALEAWGETGGCPAEVNLPREEAAMEDPVTQDWGSLLEVDSLDRLDTPDAPVEQRVAEALRSDVLNEERAEDDAALLEDIEPSEVAEEPARWEPERATAEEEESAAVFGALEPDERYFSESDAGPTPRDLPETDPEPEPVPDDFESPEPLVGEPTPEVDDRAAAVRAEKWLGDDEPRPGSQSDPDVMGEPRPFPPDMDTPGEFPEDPAERDDEIPADRLQPAAPSTLDALEHTAQRRDEQRPGKKLGKGYKPARGARPAAPARQRAEVPPIAAEQVYAAKSEAPARAVAQAAEVSVPEPAMPAATPEPVRPAAAAAPAPVVERPSVPEPARPLAQDGLDDFEPDLGSLVQRGAEVRETAAKRKSDTNREAMVNALHRFIGE